MKLKILPTHLRNKKRYLAFELRSQKPLIREDVISLIGGAMGEMYGACGASRANLWVVKVWHCGENLIKGILRCNRDEVDTVRSTLPNITQFKGGRVVVHTLGVSGTINAAKEKFVKKGIWG